MSDPRRPVCAALACLALSASVCCGSRETGVPANAEVLVETAVATVNGCRVGSGNYFETEDPSGRRRMSIMAAIWKPGSPGGSGAQSVTVFEGDTFDICGKKYRLVLVKTGRKGDIGSAYIVPSGI